MVESKDLSIVRLLLVRLARIELKVSFTGFIVLAVGSGIISSLPTGTNLLTFTIININSSFTSVDKVRFIDSIALSHWVRDHFIITSGKQLALLFGLTEK